MFQFLLKSSLWPLGPPGLAFAVMTATTVGGPTRARLLCHDCHHGRRAHQGPHKKGLCPVPRSLSPFLFLFCPSLVPFLFVFVPRPLPRPFAPFSLCLSPVLCPRPLSARAPTARRVASAQPQPWAPARAGAWRPPPSLRPQSCPRRPPSPSSARPRTRRWTRGPSARASRASA